MNVSEERVIHFLKSVLVKKIELTKQIGQSFKEDSGLDKSIKKNENHSNICKH